MQQQSITVVAFNPRAASAHLLTLLPLVILGLVIPTPGPHRPQRRELTLILNGEVRPEVPRSLALKGHIVVHVGPVPQVVEA